MGQDGPAFAPMVDIVMRLGHQLGLEVIAEGVTTPTELAAVVAAGCRFGQGSLFGWGVPAEHLEAHVGGGHLAGRPARRRCPTPPPGAPAAVQVVMLGPGMRQLEGACCRPIRAVGHRGDQHVGSVDSSREMRQA